MILGAMALGALVPQAHGLQPAIRYLIVFMLFMAFLDMRVSRDTFRGSHLAVLAAMPVIGLGTWAVLRPLHPDLALAAFIVGMTPTATASVVVTGMLGGRVDYVAASVFLTNLFAGFAVPALLGLLGGASGPIDTTHVLVPSLLTICGPLALAQALRHFTPSLAMRALHYRPLGFYAWLCTLFIVASSSSHFIRENLQPPVWRVWAIAGVAAVLCIGQFTLGRCLGGRSHSLETGQALGQKNTMFTIWVALNYLNPVVALGPTFYLIWHNLFNSWQLYRHAALEERRTAAREAPPTVASKANETSGPR